MREETKKAKQEYLNAITEYREYKERALHSGSVETLSDETLFTLVELAEKVAGAGRRYKALRDEEKRA